MPLIRIIGEMGVRTCHLPEIGVRLIDPDDVSNSGLRTKQLTVFLQAIVLCPKVFCVALVKL